ncbi:peptidoglycan DD-metalloendopeptidase family protein [Paenibacillus sp. sgz500958]|uniref:peptidoglycan DD-metalloendopeptidase family protein n=1 Tax=Paenibacillus sp. sgz500958 TaxID=3242475 RepID=UPI0036D279D6
MDQNSNIKGRRKERIRKLLEDNPELAAGQHELGSQDLTWSLKERQAYENKRIPEEPDPETMWKQRRKSWEDEEDNGRGPTFIGGFMRRLIFSALLFGLAYGAFSVQQPWSITAQDFIADALHNEMDFQSARVWYEKHFSGSPVFIPMFNGDGEPAQKVSALHEWSPPLTGSIVQPFASSLKGLEIMPKADSSGSVTVKSVDMGRVLSVSREPQGGIRITVRHSGDLTAEYGHLSGTKLEVDDWVQTGDTVGWLMQPDSGALPNFFFALMKDRTYIDPAEVITFD